MLVLFVYLTGILGGIKFFLFLVSAASVLLAVFLTLCAWVDKDEEAEAPAKISRRVVYFVVPLALLLPSEDTALQMAAAYGVTEAYEVASQSEDVKRLAGKSLELLEKHMDEALKED